MVASAYAAHVARRGAEYGFHVNGDVRLDMKPVKARQAILSESRSSSVSQALVVLPGGAPRRGTSGRKDPGGTPGARFPGPKSHRPNFLSQEPSQLSLTQFADGRGASSPFSGFIVQVHNGLKASARLTEPIREAYARVGWYAHSNDFLNRGRVEILGGLARVTARNQKIHTSIESAIQEWAKQGTSEFLHWSSGAFGVQVSRNTSRS